MHHFKNDIFLFLLAFGRIHDVNQLDDTSQENQHAEHDNHVREADRKRARSLDRHARCFKTSETQIDFPPPPLCAGAAKNSIFVSDLSAYMPNGHTIGMTTRQTMREMTHIGTPTLA